ncbi:hypothetical protein [Streptomyces sp. NEAU-YJ-81]|uniref:hypothetical protein n=1 Tax=Streptomyces sp. NEAU-YJ-81 TaxID=2820288 RepID=UPI001ABD19D0|nr:hypothetical protein [Streptomyces sp. NEAU-YJ-81]MBO3680415.1 hypothetical protein [Streptomyces sp. NEAU-YJ-81]
MSQFDGVAEHSPLPEVVQARQFLAAQAALLGTADFAEGHHRPCAGSGLRFAGS